MGRAPRWTAAGAAAEILADGARTLRADGHDVAIFRGGDGALYALDNRCPHEGYPLAKGWVKDCVVTCPWHNFKFDLRDGRCLMGDEEARTYPLRIVDGVVEVDLAGPEPAAERARLLASLDRAMERRKLGQAARDVVRLLSLGAEPAEIALAVARFDAERAEHGTTHAMPVAADALRLARRFGGVEAALPLMQAVDLAAESHQLRPARPVPAPADPGEDPVAAGERLRALIEAEEGAAAEALLRGALARGWGREVVEPWLFAACADHFLDFGHALIYQIKVFDLLAQVGWRHAETLLPAHLRGIVDGTREDLLAEWAWFRRSLDAVAPRLDALWAAAAAARPPRGDALFAAVVDGGRQEAFDAVVAELARGAGPAAIVDVLVAAAAERILRFDVAIDGDPTVQEGWLDVTHLLTFTAAVRQALARYRRPEALRLVLQATRFINHARPLDLPVTGRPDVAPRPSPATTSAALAQVRAAVASRDPDAPAIAAGYLAAGHPVENLRIALEDLCLDDVATRPIVVGHLIKTCVAAFDEHDALPAGEPRRAWPVLALVRLLSSPVRERPVRRLTHEAIQLVIHGKVQRTLT